MDPDRHNPQIESIDTSNPIMAALEGIKYSPMGLHIKPEANMNEYFDMEENELEYGSVLYNVNKFRRINGFNPISE